MGIVGENKTLRGAGSCQGEKYHANCDWVLTDGFRAKNGSPLRVYVRHQCELKVSHRLSDCTRLGL
jgi:hypothetical protein